MDNVKNDQYYVSKIVTDLTFLLKHTMDKTIDDLNGDEVLLDSIMFRLIQISENAGKLSEEYKNERGDIPWHAIKGLRNRIVHEYGSVDLSVIYDTVTKDIPELYEILAG